MLLAATAAFVLALGGTALAQQYPPGPTPETLVPGQVPARGAAPAAGEGLAITGSNTMMLVWIGLAVLMVGVALVVAARRRAAIRHRGVSEAIA
jgi:LPXTG-motif cell wall-anchored protein